MSRRFCLTAAFLILSATATTAQNTGTPGGLFSGNPKDRAVEEKLRSDEIERVKRDAEKPEKKSSSTEATFPQIKEDFERIQIINIRELQTQDSGVPLDYARISAAASEIKKRAARLKENLFSSDSEQLAEEKKKESEEAQDLKSLLAELDGAISVFVRNPMFRNLRVVNAQNSAKARHQIERIIKLSARVRQEAEKKKKRGD
jgi:hypothetical protein